MNTKQTEQMSTWANEFGKEYTDRNPHTAAEMNKMYEGCFGLTRTQLNQEFLDSLPRDSKILEVGANVGAQLAVLQEMGFTNLYGIELQGYAVEQSKKYTKGINLIQGSAFDLPFKENYFDLVYTSGVLIHISPADLPKALAEIFRCAKKYIWGFEYYDETYREVTYRGKPNHLWKGNFADIYMKQFPGSLQLQKSKMVPYIDQDAGNTDNMFLLEKK